MKRPIIFQTPAPGKPSSGSVAGRIFTLMLAGLLGIFSSCQKDEQTNIAVAGDLAILNTETAIALSQKNDQNTAITMHWTTGTNSGTGAPISYVLQIDKAGNNFADPLVFEMGKAMYEKSFKVLELNESLLGHFGFLPGVQSGIETRVIATIYSSPNTTSTSPVVSFSVTPYEPVSKTLYVLGTASPNGLDADKAIALTPDVDDPTMFVYKGSLGAGSFNFITTKGLLLPSYQKGADNNHIVYRTADGQPESQFSISEQGMYKITVKLLDLTISIAKLALPPYDHIYMVGDATPNGWDIATAAEFTQNADNPYIFTYSGVMKPGDFKLPVNRNSDWAQDMYMKTSDSTMYLHHGGAADDNKWTIAKKGYYTITLNLLDNTISMKRTRIYMVGSATPIGWSIDKAVELTEDGTDGCIFTYNGPMVAGEFKFPVNRNSDWGQDMYMPLVDITHMYRHKGGAADDNKWSITADGNYIIVTNLETLTISIQKQ
jgi:starch-binding outer membrane protein SusE/F